MGTRRECLSMVRAYLPAFTFHSGKDAGQIRKEMRKPNLPRRRSLNWLNADPIPPSAGSGSSKNR